MTKAFFYIIDFLVKDSNPCSWPSSAHSRHTTDAPVNTRITPELESLPASLSMPLVPPISLIILLHIYRKNILIIIRNPDPAGFPFANGLIQILAALPSPFHCPPASSNHKRAGT